MQTRRTFLGQALAAPLIAADRRPNILWISIEDTSPVLGCYGDPCGITPNLDRLAAQGVRYTNVYTVAGVCAPSRSGIITGMYPSALGSMHMRCQARLPEHVKCFPEYLREAGYYCTNNVKTDYNFPVPPKAWDESSNQAHYRNRPAGKPFFSVFNLTTTHESQIRLTGDAWAKRTANVKPGERQDLAKLAVPPYWPDTPVVRRQLGNFYELVTQVDYEIGRILGQLEADGLAGDTIVFFWGDHGMGLPRAKRWLYDSGTRVPLLIRVPEKFRTGAQGRPGTVDSQLVNAVDFGPTVLNLAGVPAPGHMHGQAFLGANLRPQRQYCYGARDRMDERYDIIRAVRDRRYRYVRNYESYKPYYQYMNTSEGSPIMQELRRVHGEGKLRPEAEQFMAGRKPPEELYDLQTDPHEVRNLAKSPAHRKELERLRKAHNEWMDRIGDVGLIPEPELVEGERRYGTRYAILRQPGREGLGAKLRAAVAAGERGDAAALTPLLKDREPALRYWAAIGLGNAGKTEALRPLLKDGSAVVRIAAARGLKDTAALAAELKHKDEWTRLEAAIALDEMRAGALLKPALEDENNYVQRVANHAQR
ncbi:MAG: sulfatase-like hydrolase/transferase [Bryobacteraceae bacterium]